MTSAEEVEYNLNKLSFPLRATSIFIGVFFNVRKSYTPNLFIFFELIKYTFRYMRFVVILVIAYHIL